MELLIIFILIGIVALFTFSITYINLANGNTSGYHNKSIQKILKKPGKYIIRAELAITTIGFLIGGIAVETYAIPLVIDLAEMADIPIVAVKYLAIVLITVIFSYTTTIFGKYIPKHLAIRSSGKRKHLVLFIFNILSIILLPITIIGSIFETIVTLVYKPKNDIDYKMQEIIEFTNIGYEKGTIKKYEKDIIDKTIKLSDIKVHDIYKKIDDITSVDIDSDFKKIYSVFKKSEYSRIPVYKGTKTNIIGVLYIKDILYNLKRLEKGTLRIKSIMRLPLYESNNVLLSTMLRKMKESQIHIVVIKEGEENLGILTLEDIIEKIFGSIKDEFEN